jgi:hypothetical protein
MHICPNIITVIYDFVCAAAWKSWRSTTSTQENIVDGRSTRSSPGVYTILSRFTDIRITDYY